MTHFNVSLALLTACVCVAACNRSDDGDSLHKINGSVHVAAGHAAAAAQTVNGGVEIEAKAAVADASTVNGAIHLGDGATADSLRTVNGSITLGAGAHVAGGATTVNGGVALEDAAEVLGGIRNVNGAIKLSAAHVAGGIKTVGGNVTVRGASRVEGGIVIEKSNDLFKFGTGVPRIEIGPGATVQGAMDFGREVKLYVSDKATIGPVNGATPIPFTGDTAPAE